MKYHILSCSATQYRAIWRSVPRAPLDVITKGKDVSPEQGEVEECQGWCSVGGETGRKGGEIQTHIHLGDNDDDGDDGDEEWSYYENQSHIHLGDNRSRVFFFRFLIFANIA